MNDTVGCNYSKNLQCFEIIAFFLQRDYCHNVLCDVFVPEQGVAVLPPETLNKF